jgi:hypothetical protein
MVRPPTKSQRKNVSEEDSRVLLRYELLGLAVLRRMDYLQGCYGLDRPPQGTEALRMIHQRLPPACISTFAIAKLTFSRFTPTSENHQLRDSNDHQLSTVRRSAIPN